MKIVNLTVFFSSKSGPVAEPTTFFDPPLAYVETAVFSL